MERLKIGLSKDIILYIKVMSQFQSLEQIDLKEHGRNYWVNKKLNFLDRRHKAHESVNLVLFRKGYSYHFLFLKRRHEAHGGVNSCSL